MTVRYLSAIAAENAVVPGELGGHTRKYVPPYCCKNHVAHIE
jgi:hypothetical protein